MSDHFCKNCEWWETKSKEVGYCIVIEERSAAHDHCEDFSAAVEKQPEASDAKE